MILKYIVMVVGIVTSLIMFHELIHFVDTIIINKNEFVEMCFLGIKKESSFENGTET